MFRDPTPVIPPRRPCALRSPITPAVSLRSTAGYRLAPLPGCWVRAGESRCHPNTRHPARKRGIHTAGGQYCSGANAGECAGCARRRARAIRSSFSPAVSLRSTAGYPLAPLPGCWVRGGERSAWPPPSSRAKARDAPADAHARHARSFPRGCRFAPPPATFTHPLPGCWVRACESRCHPNTRHPARTLRLARGAVRSGRGRGIHTQDWPYRGGTRISDSTEITLC